MRDFAVLTIVLALGCGADDHPGADAGVDDSGADSVGQVDVGADGSNERYIPPGSCTGATSVPVGSMFCSGVGNTGSLECGRGRSCVPDDPECPAGCTGPAAECSSDSECGDDLCQRARGPATACCPDPYWFTRCAPSCTGDAECGEGDRCEADGHCRPISCLDGNACPSTRVCDPERVGGLVDAQGCTVANCMLDDFVCPANAACTSTSPVQGGCELIVCDASTPCGENFDCDLASGACVILGCGSNDDCDCGACINMGCAPRAYVCVDE